jgi:hypothetical protein
MTLQKLNPNPPVVFRRRRGRAVRASFLGDDSLSQEARHMREERLQRGERDAALRRQIEQASSPRRSR